MVGEVSLPVVSLFTWWHGKKARRTLGWPGLGAARTAKRLAVLHVIKERAEVSFQPCGWRLRQQHGQHSGVVFIRSHPKDDRGPVSTIGAKGHSRGWLTRRLLQLRQPYTDDPSSELIASPPPVVRAVG